jgi:hypothetical protein
LSVRYGWLIIIGSILVVVIGLLFTHEIERVFIKNLFHKEGIAYVRTEALVEVLW